MATGAPLLSENEDWLAVLSYSTLIAYPLAIDAALKLDVFEILHSHGALSAQQIAGLLPRPASNRRAPFFLDHLLHLLASPSPAFARPLLLAASPSPTSALIYSLLPPAHFFLRGDRGVSPGRSLCDRSMTLLSAYRHLDSVIVDGSDGFHKEFSHHVSHHVAEHAQELEAVMATITSLLMKQLLDVYDGFAHVRVLADVGGATGYTLIHILDKYPQLQGINFDQPSMVAKGLPHPRLKHVGGNMLESVPPADAVMMKTVLHDWEDDECIKILKNCKNAVSNEHGKVVVVDFYVPELVDGVAPKHHLDILMMASHGGKARTLTDYKRLGEAAGFGDVKLACIVNEYYILEFLL